MATKAEEVVQLTSNLKLIKSIKKTKENNEEITFIIRSEVGSWPHTIMTNIVIDTMDAAVMYKHLGRMIGAQDQQETS